GLNRRQMIENYEKFLGNSSAVNFGVIDGQLDFLGNESAQGMTLKVPEIPEYSQRKLLAMEKEATGIYLSGNPLAEYEYISSLMKTRKIADISANVREGETVRLLCLVQNKKIHSLRNKSEKMCFLEISDGTGEIDAVVFPDLYAESADFLNADNIILVTGKVSVKDENISVVCSSIVREEGFSAMTADMKLCIITDGQLVSDDLLKICRDFSGSTQVVFYLRNARKTVLPKSRISVDINAESFLQLEKIYNKADMGLIR
ncbi:MAG: DNA polymerase III subunit alpha, partial [Ruminococcus sp.]|nr:DNA polymerase III subunit alpha [Ruminococcus sp.]